MIKKVLLYIFWCLLSTAPVFATNYYVDATAGDDSNNGFTELSAWKTLSKINSGNYNAGDSILLKRGETWTGEYFAIHGNGNGTSVNPIFLETYGTGNKPVIDANSAQTYALSARNINYWTIEDIEFKGGTLYQIYICAQSSNMAGIKVSNCVINGVMGSSHCIKIQEDGVYEITDLEICNSEIKNAGNGIGNTDGINIYKAKSGASIHSNIIFGCGGEGIDVAGGENHKINKNFVYQCNAAGIKVHGQQYNLVSVTVNQNVINRNGSVGGHGLLIIDSTSGTILNNTIHMESGEGHYAAMGFDEITTPGSFYGNAIKNNISYGNPVYNSGCWNISNSIIDDFNTANAFSANLIYTTNSVIIFMEGGTNITNDNWASVWLPNHARDIKTDPCFVNASLNNFHIQNSSPCINIGSSVSLVNDFDGNSMFGLPDIGAYEYLIIDWRHLTLGELTIERPDFIEAIENGKHKGTTVISLEKNGENRVVKWTEQRLDINNNQLSVRVDDYVYTDGSIAQINFKKYDADNNLLSEEIVNY